MPPLFLTPPFLPSYSVDLAPCMRGAVVQTHTEGRAGLGVLTSLGAGLLEEMGPESNMYSINMLPVSPAQQVTSPCHKKLLLLSSSGP